MLANYGEKPVIPKNDQYMVKGQSTSGHRIGIFLSNT